MPTPPSDDTRMLFRLLADEQWHPYEVIRDQLAAKVPPGRALRKYDERLERSRRFRNNQTTETPHTEDERQLYGARACAQVTITSWKGRGLMQRIENGRKEIRVKPGFKVWGIESSAADAGSHENPRGYTDLPGRDSEPSTARAEPAEEASEDQGDPEPEPEPEPEPGPVVVLEPGPVRETNRPAEWASVRWPTLAPAPAPVTPEPEPSHVTCSDCGGLVFDQARHDDWHRRLLSGLGSQSTSVVDEVTSPTEKGVFEEALDRFQAGMQDWLEAQFEQLSEQIAAARNQPPVRKPWA